MNELTVIQQKIHIIRGQRVMLDYDLAAAYGVETAQLKRQVRRNMERFEGDDFIIFAPGNHAVFSRVEEWRLLF